MIIFCVTVTHSAIVINFNGLVLFFFSKVRKNKIENSLFLCSQIYIPYMERMSLNFCTFLRLCQRKSRSCFSSLLTFASVCIFEISKIKSCFININTMWSGWSYFLIIFFLVICVRLLCHVFYMLFFNVIRKGQHVELVHWPVEMLWANWRRNKMYDDSSFSEWRFWIGPWPEPK